MKNSRESCALIIPEWPWLGDSGDFADVCLCSGSEIRGYRKSPRG